MQTWREKVELLPGDEAFRARVSFYASIIIIALLTIAIPLRHQANPLRPGVLVQLAASYLISCGSLWAIWRYPGSIWGRCSILVALYAIAIPGLRNDGLSAPIAALLIVIPVIASVLIGKRPSIIFLVIGEVTMAAAYVASSRQLLTPGGLPPGLPQHSARLIVYSSLLWMATGIAFFSERTRQALRDDQIRMQNALPAGFAKVKEDGTILERNRQFEVFLGIAPRDRSLFGALADTRAPESRPIPARVDVLCSNPVEVRTKSGTWLAVTAAHLTSQPGLYAIFLTDVSAHKRELVLEEQLTKAKTAKAMVATYNHTINNPLMIAMWKLYQLKSSTPALTAEVDAVLATLDIVAKTTKKIEQVAETGKVETEEYAGGSDMIKIT